MSHPRLSASGLLFPKPRKRDRPGQIRKRQIKAKDKAFQMDMPSGATCVVPGCKGKPGKHHRIKRQHMETRYDDRFAVAICWLPHHQELEIIGEKKFAAKYNLPYPLPTIA